MRVDQPARLSTAGLTAQRRTGQRANHERMTDNTPAGDSAPRSYLGTPAVRPGGVAGKVQLRAGSAEAVLAVVP